MLNSFTLFLSITSGLFFIRGVYGKLLEVNFKKINFKKILFIALIILILARVLVFPFNFSFANETDTKYLISVISLAHDKKPVVSGTSAGGGLYVFSLFTELFNITSYYDAEKFIQISMFFLLIFLFIIIKAIMKKFQNNPSNVSSTVFTLLYFSLFYVSTIFFNKKFYYLLAYIFFLTFLNATLNFVKNPTRIEFILILSSYVLAGLTRPEFFIFGIFFFGYLIYQKRNFFLKNKVHLIWILTLATLGIYLFQRILVSRISNSPDFSTATLIENLKLAYDPINSFIILLILVLSVISIIKIKEFTPIYFFGSGIVIYLLYVGNYLFDLILIMFYVLLLILLPTINLLSRFKHQNLIMILLVVLIILGLSYNYNSVFFNSGEDTLQRQEATNSLIPVLNRQTQPIYYKYGNLYYDLVMSETSAKGFDLKLLNKSMSVGEDFIILLDIYTCNDSENVLKNYVTAENLSVNITNFKNQYIFLENKSLSIGSFYNLCYFKSVQQ